MIKKIIAIPKIIPLVIISALYFWISFLAPFSYNHVFTFNLAFSFIFLLASLTAKGSFRAVFCKEEIVFWLFIITIFGGLANAYDKNVLTQQYWLFIYPIPLFYFINKFFVTDKNLWFVSCVLVFSCSILAAYGFFEFFAKENYIYSHFVKNVFYNTFKGRRIMSLHIHPAPFATYLIGVFPLSVLVLLKAKRGLVKKASWCCAALIFLAVIFTFSRSALIALSFILCFLLAFLAKNKKPVIILFFVFVFLVIFASSIFSRLGFLGFARYSLENLSQSVPYSRKLQRLAALIPILRDHPFFGLGFGHYRVLFDYYLPNVLSGYAEKVADCMYITILAESGLIGFFGFILFIGSLIRRCFQRINLEINADRKLFLIAVMAGFIGMGITFLTYDGLYWLAPSALFWSFAGILSSLVSKSLHSNG